MSEVKQIVFLFPSIDENLDLDQIQSMLLTLEKEQTHYLKLNVEIKELKNQLNVWEKINPFSERDLKGEILKVKIELEGIATNYESDILFIMEQVNQAILLNAAFQSKFLMIQLHKKIKEISASATSGAAWVSGKDEAIKAADNIYNAFIRIYGNDFDHCPPRDDLVEAYMDYILEPFHLPNTLKN